MTSAGRAAPRPRRSHAERTQQTRARILAAVVESIAEVGFRRTTATEIARRAGVTWGAVQHHFGDKDGILIAVLEDSFARFAEELADADAGRGPLEARVARFVERAWAHFGSPHYRSTFEILLHSAGPEGPGSERLWQSEMLASWNRIWSEYFGDARHARRRSVMLQHYTISVLSGLASMQMLEGPGAHIRADELALLRDTLVRELVRKDG